MTGVQTCALPILKQLRKSGKTHIEVYSHTPRLKALHDYMQDDSEGKEDYNEEWDSLSNDDDSRFQRFFAK